MLEMLASAWFTAIWWAAVIFFIGLFLGIVTLVMAAVIFLISTFLDAWAARHVDKEE